MFKWIITIAVVYFLYRWWESRKRYLEKRDRQKEIYGEEEEYTDYEEVE